MTLGAKYEARAAVFRGAVLDVLLVFQHGAEGKMKFSSKEMEEKWTYLKKKNV